MDELSSQPDVGEKRGRLIGGAATDEVLASSRSVLSPNRAGRARGIQQYFVPLRAAAWIASVLGPGGQVFDPTAGDGALLSGFHEASRFGTEIDADQVRAARRLKRPYHAVRGDLQHVYPLLRRIGVEFSKVVCNPPFGLEWQVPSLDPPKGSSTLLGFAMAQELLQGDGRGCLVAGRDRFYREVLPVAPNAFFAVVEVERLFPGVDLPCVVAFFVGRNQERNALAESRFIAQLRSASDLTDELRAAVEKTRDGLIHYWSGYEDAELVSKFKAVQQEYERRLGLRSAQQRDTIDLEGRRLRVRPSAYTKLALANHPDGNRNAWLEGFDRQAPTYFAMQLREWRRVLALADEGVITISDRARRAVDEASAEIERIAVPLYKLNPVQRLGYLVDVDNIRCRVSDPAREFVAGELYAISCGTDVLATKAQREQQTPKGIEVYEVVVERKAMRITIGAHQFTESADDLDYILGHFDVPDPGEIASRFPDEIAAWERLVADIEREIQERVPGFRFYWFQPCDVSRLLFKGRGLLGWEQGCGKTVAIGTLLCTLERSGDLADGCALIVMPHDLVDQFSGQVRHFFGRELVRIGSAAELGRLVDGAPSPAPFASSNAWRVGAPQSRRRSPSSEHTAVEVRAMVRARREDLGAQRRGVHLAPRPPVWAVTWFEAMAITMRAREPAPAVPVVRRIDGRREARAAGDGGDSERKSARTERWSWELCPHCRSDVKGGWDPARGVCAAELPRTVDAFHQHDQVSTRRRYCGYVHRSLLRKPAYSVLRGVFDAVVVDEATKIQGDSLAAKAIFALQPRYRFAATGTAIKNFVPSAFRPLLWVLGNASPRFPYSYRGGMERFIEDFAVTETRLDEWGGKAKNARPKLLPEVSNLLRLWRIFSSSIVRRRMDEVGVVVSLDGDWTCHACKRTHRADVNGPNGWNKPARVVCAPCNFAWDTIVPITYIPVECPWGKAQKRFYLDWLCKDKFERHFRAKHPESKIPAHLIQRLAAGLGQLAKLSYAAVDPTGNPDPDYKTPDLSPWTPARLQTLMLAAKHVAQGDQVLVASTHVAVGPWVRAELRARGIAAADICEVDAGGRPVTLPPTKRADVIARFKAGEIRVLCVGVQAVNLGHSLECASVLIFNGLPHDFGTKDQMIKRIRRLTSTKPTTAYIIMPTASLTTKIWSRLKDKTAASDLALDGKLSRYDEAPIDGAAILRELQEEGAQLDGTEVPESHVCALWQRLPLEAGDALPSALPLDAPFCPPQPSG